MLYSTLKVGDKEYKLRLGAQQTVEVEKQLGKSVLDVLLGMAPDNVQGIDANNIKGVSMPFVGDIVTILHGAIQKYQHEIDLPKTYDIYDEYIDAGGSFMDFFGILQEILQVSGFLPKAAKVPLEKAGQENGSAA